MPPLSSFKLSVVIPLYNESSTIQQIVERVKQSLKKQNLNAEILVVNDGSTDNSAEISRTIPEITFIDSKKNCGKGAAVKKGFERATGEIFLIQDADLEYDPADYTSLIEPILKGECMVTMGSRFLLERPVFFGKKKSPYFAHYLGNLLIVWLTNFLYGGHYTDYEGCYKVLKAETIRSIQIHSNGFEYENELICKVLKRGYKIVEVPIHYCPRTYEDGKKITWKNGLKILWTIFKYRFID